MPANDSDCRQAILRDRVPVAGYGYTTFILNALYWHLSSYSWYTCEQNIVRAVKKIIMASTASKSGTDKYNELSGP